MGRAGQAPPRTRNIAANAGAAPAFITRLTLSALAEHWRKAGVVAMSGSLLMTAVGVSAAFYSVGYWLIGSVHPAIGLTLVTFAKLLLFVALVIYVVMTGVGIFLEARNRREKH